MAERQPTNTHIVELLHRLEEEVRELKQVQQQLAADVRRLTASSDRG